ncbi:hypothetical protein THRCLA_04076 [Thraustotheca clavata]|uniref:RING-type E3 ubiquitin transferase BRCA1 n=1 Tax=Thraustotheca clavata TaxID=74557 RepID=A0A1W0A016_9STRA|nr:hypothetical protein THRCLA_04076 [Thraustotheca clavata]
MSDNPLIAALESFAVEMRCPICLETLDNPRSLPCNHCFCENCITTALGFAGNCPVCKAPVRKRTLRIDPSIERIHRALKAIMEYYAPIEVKKSPVMRPPLAIPTKRVEVCIDLVEETEIDNTQATQIEPQPALRSDTSNENKAAIEFTGGQVVQVAARTWPGINKLGGTAWIVERNEDGTYNVKYVLGGRESHVDPAYISLVGQDCANASTPTRAVGTRKRASPSVAVATPEVIEEYEDTNRRRPKKKQQLFKEDLVFLCSGLYHDEKVLVETCATMLNATTVHEWTEDVTHVIVKCQQTTPSRQKLQISDKVKRWVKIRSLKYLKAVVAGRWIVSEEWIRACVKAKGLVSEENFEVQGLLKLQHVPEVAKKARLRRQANLIYATGPLSAIGTRLFSAITCTVYGNFASPLPPKNEIGSLVRLGHGHVVSTIDDLTEAAKAKPAPSNYYVVIVENMDVNLPLSEAAAGLTIYVVSYEWILDSVSECALRPLQHLLQT